MTKAKRRRHLGSSRQEGGAEEMTLQAYSQGQSFIVLSKRDLWEDERGCDHPPLSTLHIPGSDCGCQ